MAEQKYSESDSSSSDSTMLVKIIQNIIEGDMYIHQCQGGGGGGQ